MLRTKVLLFCALFCLQACENNDNTQIPGLKGSVTSFGNPVADASISLANDASNYQTSTGLDGTYTFTDIRTGEYILTIKSQSENGKFIQFKKNVSVLNETSNEDIELPEGVTLTEPSAVTDRGADIKWTKSYISNFLEYKLYRHNTAGLDETTGELIHVSTNANDTLFSDTGLRESEAYYYRVFVRNTFGFYGGSNIAMIATKTGNYFQNGDFEADLDKWELYSPDPCASIAEDPTSPAGSKVLELNLDTPDEANVSAEILQYISQNNFIPGETYVMTFWAKAEIPLEAQTWIMLRNSSTWNSVATPIIFTAATSNVWTKYSTEFISPTFSSPALLTIEADPYLPFTGTETYRVLLDGFEMHRK